MAEDKITSIIDWQATWAGPLFLQYRQPPLVDYSGEILTELPENFKDLEEDERARVSEQVANSILLYIYETTTADENPLLSEILRMEHGLLRKQTIAFAGNTWDSDIKSFRQTLIRVKRSVDTQERYIPYFSPKLIEHTVGTGTRWVLRVCVRYISQKRRYGII